MMALAPAERDLALAQLRGRLLEGRRAAQHERHPVLVSVSEVIPACDPLDAFAVGGEQCAYWEHEEPDGTRRIRIAGLGAVQRIRAEGTGRFKQAAGAWRDLLDHALIDAPDGPWGTGPLLMGGFSFDPACPRSAEWSGFPDCLLMLPHISVLTSDDGCRLTMNCLVSDESDVDREVATLRHLRTRILHAPTDSPDPHLTPALRHTLDGVSDETCAQPTAVGRVPACGWLPAGYQPPGYPLVGRGGRGLHVQATLREAMPGERWRALVEETARAIRAGHYAKVVLARQALLDLPAAPRVRAARALRRLRAAYPGSFRFAIAVQGQAAGTEPRPGESIFLGATPERLLRLERGMVETDVLAGSAPRGATPEEDHALGQELLSSAKDRHEHAVVAMMLRVALAACCRALDAPEAPTLMRLQNVQHLYTPVHGRLDRPRSIVEIIERLHPTPAVGGFPRQTALRVIREREELDRGWYAAPVGWLDRQGQGEFAVAIRSALLRAGPIPAQAGSEARLFAGCGIMGDSDPEREYAESMIKMQAMLRALTE